MSFISEHIGINKFIDTLNLKQQATKYQYYIRYWVSYNHIVLFCGRMIPVSIAWRINFAS